jgi:LysM repeat protein
MVNRRRRSLGRWLAPVALITCVVAVYAVVDNTLLKDDSASSGTDSTQQAKPGTTTTKGKAAKKSKRRRAYIVKSGDTLSAISIKTGVSLATIQRLNPKLDADTLHAGQRVRLSR